MPDSECDINHIFEAIPESLKQTTDNVMVNNVPVELVNPEKVVRLVSALAQMGFKQVCYVNHMRQLDAQLAEHFAKAAHDILLFTVRAIKDHQIPLETAMNWGSTITGLVTPESDVDIQIHLPTKKQLNEIGILLRTDTNFREEIWHVSDFMPRKISFVLSVPSLYVKYPDDKWIPDAHDSVNLTSKLNFSSPIAPSY